MRKIVLGVSAILLSLLTVADPVRAQVSLSNTPFPSDSAGPLCYTDFYGYAVSVPITGCAFPPCPSSVPGGGQVTTGGFSFPSGLSGVVRSSVHPRVGGGGAGYNYQIQTTAGVGSVSSLSVPFGAPLVFVTGSVSAGPGPSPAPSPSLTVIPTSVTSVSMLGCNDLASGACTSPNPTNNLDDQGFAFTPSPLSAFYPSVGTVPPTSSNITTLSGGTYRTGFTGLAAGLTSRIFGVATSLPGAGTTCAATLTDSAGNTTSVLVVCSGPIITTVAGTGVAGFTGDGGSATAARLNAPAGTAVDTAGNVYIADSGNHVIRQVSAANGTITTVAGTPGMPGSAGDGGSAVLAQLNAPQGVAVDGMGTLYIADFGNNRIRKVSGGIITTVAGGGTAGPPLFGDGGPATSAQLKGPYGVAVDPPGTTLFIADSGHQVIRTVSGGTITTFAGRLNKHGFAGDGGSATLALLNNPQGVAVDGMGNVYIADYANQLIRKVSGGTITTVAGTPNAPGFAGDGGLATAALLFFPKGVAVDPSGTTLFIADSLNQRIRKVVNPGPSGTITTVAGTGVASFGGDGGSATAAQLNGPIGVALDSSRNLLFIADSLNQRIRRVAAP